MSSVDRIANQLLRQDRRISALERSRSLSKSALVNASIPVMATNPDTGELEIVGELGQPTFEDIGKLYDDSVKFSEDMAEAQGKLEEVETGLATAQDTANAAAAEAQAARQEVETAVEAAGDAAALAATAAQAAQDAAGVAQTAQNTAEDARTVAEGTADDLLTLAGRTGRLIRSATPPTGDDATENNLWIDTSSGQLHEYDGTEWVPVTDPRLVEASQKADQAAAQATTAAEAADRAEALAEASKALAESASTVAGDAQAAALAAQSEASAATATATAAQTASQTAQQTAQQALDDAAAAAGIAEGKADLWTSSTTPPAAYRRENVLWYDPAAKVLKRWTTGTTWVVVEEQAVIDAAAAAAEARDSALQAIEDAQHAKDAADAAAADALLAQNAADEAGNKASTASGLITVASTNPTTQDGVGKPDGALWEAWEGYTSMRRFVWDGSAWTQVKIGQDFVGDNAIGSAQIIEAAIGTAEIADAAITNAKIGDMDVGKLTVTDTARIKQAVVEKIMADAAFFKALQANGIIVAGDTTNLVDAIMLADGAVTAPKINATAELWTKLLTVAGDATIGGNLIVDESISTRHLMIGAVTPEALADATLDQISRDISDSTGALGEAVSGDIQSAIDTVTRDRETILAEYATQESVDTGIEGAVTSATELIEQLGLSLSTDLQEYQEHIDQFIRMDDNGIAIGKLGSPFSVRITNTQMSFLQGTRVVAYLSNDRLYITDAEIVNRLSLGRPGSGFFEFEPRTNGNLTFKFRSA